MIKSTFFISIIAIFLFSCKEDEPEHVVIDWNKEKSTKMHQNLAKEEEIDIRLYLARHTEWEMEKTGSGLQYFIYEHGEGDSIKVGDIAQVEYEISLLDGTICYATADDEVEEFVVDRAQIESGIQEGVKLLHKGDKVKFIFPSHLGHGLIGDLDKIPPLTPLIVDLYLRDIK